MQVNFAPSYPYDLDTRIVGNLTTWPELTSAQVRKFPPHSAATIKGHQHAQRINIKSTKIRPQSSNANNVTVVPEDSTPGTPMPIPFNTDELVLAPIFPSTISETIEPALAHLPIEPPPGIRTNKQVFASCQQITGRIFSDQTGRFVVPSSSGNQYLFVLYDYDSNTIHAEPIPSRTKHQILSAYKKVINLLEDRGFKSKLQRLNNEASGLLKDYMHSKGIDFQLTPAGIHRRNLAERAIHFITGLCSTHPDFPLNLWDKLVPQAVLTLNLLRPSRTNPKLSGHAHLHDGLFDYNRTPMAPHGIKEVLLHERPEDRGSWSPYSIDGWYIGPSLDHYRCHRVWIPETSSELIGQTVTWFPHNFKMPTPPATDIIISAAKDLTAALKQTNASPLLPPANTVTRQAPLHQLADIFANKPATAATSPHVDLPRVLPSADTPRVVPPVLLPRVMATSPSSPASLLSPTTTAGFNNITAIRNRIRRQRRSPPSPSTLTSASPPLSLPIRRSTCTRMSTQAATFAYAASILLGTQAAIFAYAVSMLPSAINDAINQEIERASDPTMNLFLRANAVLDPSTGNLLEYRDLIKGPDKEKWYNACAKEFGRILNGRKSDNSKGTNTLFFKHSQELPKGCKATYLRVVANIRPQKADPYRIRFTVGGDRVTYTGNVHTPTADITTAKILFNSVLSTPGARVAGADLTDFYLKTPMEWIPASIVPPKNFGRI